MQYDEQISGQSPEIFNRKDFIQPEAAKYGQPKELVKVLELVIGVSVLCENKDLFINEIVNNLEEDVQ